MRRLRQRLLRLDEVARELQVLAQQERGRSETTEPRCDEAKWQITRSRNIQTSRNASSSYVCDSSVEQNVAGQTGKRPAGTK